MNGKIQGRGIYKWPDESKNEGDYIKIIKEGIRKFSWASGKCFEGSCKNEKLNGARFSKLKIKTWSFFNDGKVDEKIREIDKKNNYNYP